MSTPDVYAGPMHYTGSAELKIAREHVLDHVLGSGLDFPWWHSVMLHPDGDMNPDGDMLIVKVDDPEADEGTPKTVHVMVKWVAVEFIERFARKPGTSIDSDGCLDLDLDADDVDLALQHAVFGKQVYS